MTEGIIGKKLGMTQVFGETGKTEAVTAIEAGPCMVMQVKTIENDGYSAIKMGFGEKKTARSKKGGKSKDKPKAEPRYMRELPLESGESIEVGQKIDVSIFKPGDAVDVTGISRGKGFAGGVKRYHFSGGLKTHGQSDRWRAPGAVGANTTPGRTWKGQHMAGHLGSERVTVSNLKVIQTDPERNLLLVKGAVPGMTNGLLLIRKSIKGTK